MREVCYKAVHYGHNMAIVPMNAKNMSLLDEDLHKNLSVTSSPCVEEELMGNQHAVRDYAVNQY